MSTSLSVLISGLKKVSHSGTNSWSALCPAHEDRNPSLSITNKDGKILVRCHAGCSQESVINALKEMGLWSSQKKQKPDNEYDPTHKKMGKIFTTLDEIIDFLKNGKDQAKSKIYNYPGDWGVVRIDFTKNDEKKKLIRPFHAIPGGFALGDPPGPLSLYSTRDVTVGKDDIIYVVEGEKCVDAMGRIGLPAVTSAHGSQSAAKSDWTPLKGRDINIIPDNDDPGMKYAEEVRTILEDMKCFVRIINPYTTGSPEGFDVADLVEGEGPEGIKEKILAAPDWKEKETIQNQNWEEDLMRTEKGNLKQNTHNLLLIIENDPDFSNVRFNEFTKTTLINGEKLETAVLVRLAAVIEKKYSLPGALTEKTLAPICETVAKKRPFHPILDWLEGLKWDRVLRIDRLFKKYYGTQQLEDYIQAVSRNFMIGAVARIYRPGCKLDNMVVLEGKQGIKKSSSLKALFGDEFTSEVKASPDSKDFDQALHGMWCLEFAELDSLQRADITRIKMQLSTQSDWVRLPYKPSYQSFPRQSVFVGTTNDDGYLKDPTGARRFWPVKCIQVDIEGIRHDREQLFAEAVHRFKAGESWWEIPPGAEEEQDLRFQHDVWEEYILPFLAGKDEITMAEIFGEECLNARKYQSDRAMQIRVGNILKRHGWEKKRVRTNSGRAYTYVPITNIGTDRDNIGTASTRAIVPIVPIENGDLYKWEEISGGHNASVEYRGLKREETDRDNRDIGTSEQNQSLKDVPMLEEDVPILDLNLFLREG